jgi:hypothetical protein
MKQKNKTLIIGIVCFVFSLGLFAYSQNPLKFNLHSAVRSSPSLNTDDTEMTAIEFPPNIESQIVSLPDPKWSLYKNTTYHFSFQFPKAWILDPLNGGKHYMEIGPVPPKEIGGGYNVGIIVDEIYENKENLNLDEFIKRFEANIIKHGGTAGKYHSVPVKTNVEEIQVDPHTVGAVDGQLIFIKDRSKRIIKIYCPSCTDEVVKQLTDTFETQ